MAKTLCHGYSHLHTHATVADKQARARRSAGKMDPTRTALVRKQFESELRRRFQELMALITEEIVDGDGFGLVNGLGMIQVNARRFDFPRSGDKVSSFMRWLKREQSKGVLGIAEGTDIGASARNAWSNVYIDTAYQRGIRQAGAQLRKGGAQVSERWVESAFNRPIHADRVGLIYTRVFDELHGITQTMDARISRALSLGLSEGKNPRDIARDLNNEVDIGLNRARMIARTEVVSAHAEASLNAYTEAGVEGVTVEAEWSTTGDDLVCPLCAELEGVTMPLEQARNLLPRHPNCRCAWVPVIENARGVELR